MANSETKFKAGDVVTWTSSANGTTKTKTGRVELAKKRRGPFCAPGTDYVVFVRVGSIGRAKPRKYTPRESAMRLATPEEKAAAGW